MSHAGPATQALRSRGCLRAGTLPQSNFLQGCSIRPGNVLLRKASAIAISWRAGWLISGSPPTPLMSPNVHSAYFFSMTSTHSLRASFRSSSPAVGSSSPASRRTTISSPAEGDDAHHAEQSRYCPSCSDLEMNRGGSQPVLRLRRSEEPIPRHRTTRTSRDPFKAKSRVCRLRRWRIGAGTVDQGVQVSHSGVPFRGLRTRFLRLVHQWSQGLE